MTVLQLLSSGTGFYGAERVSVTLAAELEKAGVRCIVGAFRNCAKDVHLEVLERAQESGLTTEEIICRGRVDKEAVRTLEEIVVRHHIDVIHSHGVKSDLYALLTRRRTGVSVVSTCHSWTMNNVKDWVVSAADRLLLRRFDAVAAVSPTLEPKLCRFGVKEEAIRVIPNGIDCEPLVRPSGSDTSVLSQSRGLRIGSVARLAPVKGLKYLLDAAPRVLSEFPLTEFVLIGDGPELAALREQSVQLGISEHVHFPGSCVDMPSVYGALDVFVLPSLSEAMPMALMEAMAAGKPVVASSVGSVPAMVKNLETGILVPPADAGAIGTALCTLLRDSELRRRLGDFAQRFATTSFSAKAMALRYITLYASIATTPCARAANESLDGAGIEAGA